MICLGLWEFLHDSFGNFVFLRFVWGFGDLRFATLFVDLFFFRDLFGGFGDLFFSVICLGIWGFVFS